MPRCPNCNDPYIYGEVLCRGCGEDLDEPITLKEVPPVMSQQLPVAGVSPLPISTEATIALHVIHVDGVDFVEGSFVAVIPLSRLAVPIRIGRADRRQNPPIMPEIDLTDLVESRRRNAEPRLISRLHAALQLEGGVPAIKPLVEHSHSTWVRHTRSSSVLALVRNRPWRLHNRDVIILGSPHGRRVELRVVLSHPVR